MKQVVLRIVGEGVLPREHVDRLFSSESHLKADIGCPLINWCSVTHNDDRSIAEGDRMLMGKAMVQSNSVSRIVFDSFTAEDPHRYDTVREAGFKVQERGAQMDHLYGRFGGHYMVVGTSEKIGKGLVSYISRGLQYSNFSTTYKHHS